MEAISFISQIPGILNKEEEEYGLYIPSVI
jgi:hypothetical protein